MTLKTAQGAIGTLKLLSRTRNALITLNGMEIASGGYADVCEVFNALTGATNIIRLKIPIFNINFDVKFL